MSEILFHYQKVNPMTWVYLSSLLTIGLFFQFNRFWSVRNLDLIMLILLAPGLLMVNQARVGPEAPLQAAAVQPAPPNMLPPSAAADGERGTELPGGASAEAQVNDAASRRHIAYIGYLWLFGVSLVWLVRMLTDPTMVRRPLLEPNATKGCLVFLGCSLFLFLMANVIVSDPTPDDRKAVKSAQSLLKAQDNSREKDK